MKNTNLWIRTAIILIITLAAVFMVFGPRNSFNSSDFTWAGIKQNLANNINLGLDLKGGSHLVMHVKTDDYLSKLTNDSKDASVLAAKQANLEIGEAKAIAEKGNYQVSITVPDAAKTAEVLEAIKKKGIFDPNHWTQTTSGSTLNWSLPVQAQKTLTIQATDQVLKIIESRINQFGVKEPTLQKIGAPDSGQILLQMPGLEDPQRVKDLVGKASKLELVKVVSPASPSPVQTFATEQEALQSIGGKNTESRKVLKYFERDDRNPQASQDPQNKLAKYVVVEYPAVVDGGELRDAAAIPQAQNSTQYTISFSFKPNGAQKFGDWTGKNINNYMGVVLDDEVKSIAYIKSQIFDQGQIDGRFTKESGNDLVLTLKSGALPAKIEYQEERTVGPSLGADSIRAGVAASLGGLAFVVLFMLIYYRGSGVNAVVALVLNMLLTMAGLVWLGSTLTLPGIAGLILGIGMAVDSNVLIFERIREELRKGVEVRKSVDLGFEHAFVTIIDTHVTTIISSIILYMYGSGPIKGFAVTLILGLLINLFSAVFVSRTIFRWHLDGKPNVEKLSI
ncbi:MAG TPA: protein translocase subunit SecD [Pyrinomonadaceae bacterium]|nr:protein translocase subunit SecD [Pyrinomonadaceae bacterium]